MTTPMVSTSTTFLPFRIRVNSPVAVCRLSASPTPHEGLPHHRHLVAFTYPLLCHLLSHPSADLHDKPPPYTPILYYCPAPTPVHAHAPYIIDKIEIGQDRTPPGLPPLYPNVSRLVNSRTCRSRAISFHQGRNISTGREPRNYVTDLRV